MTTPIFKLPADSPLALLLPNLPPSQQEDLVMVLARIEAKQRQKKCGGDYWYTMAHVVEDEAPAWQARLTEGYVKPTRTEALHAITFAPRARHRALDIAAARMVLSVRGKLDKKEAQPRNASPLRGTPSVTVDYAAIVDSQLGLEVLRDALERLEEILPGDENARAVLRLTLKERSQEQMAAELGISEGQVNNAGYRARTKLRAWMRAKSCTRLAERALDHSRQRRRVAHYGWEVDVIDARLFDRGCAATDLQLPVESLRWDIDGMLTGHVTLPDDRPTTCFGFALATVASEKASLVSGAFQLSADERGEASLRAYLGKPPAHLAIRGPLQVPPGDVRLVLAQAETPNA